MKRILQEMYNSTRGNLLLKRNIHPAPTLRPYSRRLVSLGTMKSDIEPLIQYLYISMNASIEFNTSNIIPRIQEAQSRSGVSLDFGHAAEVTIDPVSCAGR